MSLHDQQVQAVTIVGGNWARRDLLTTRKSFMNSVGVEHIEWAHS